MSTAPDPKEEMTDAQFAEICRGLRERLSADPIVSEDIKQLAMAVAILADGLRDTRETLAELAARPVGRSISVNYGK